MAIPTDLKIFSFIYEYRLWVLVPLYAVWIMIGFHFLIRLKKVFFLWLLIFPLLLSPLNIAFVYSGWHYRMELRDRYAVVSDGISGYNSQKSKVYNINLMPADIRREYAKDGYRPRRRGVIAQVIWVILLTPVTLLGQWILYRIFFRRKKDAEGPALQTAPADWERHLARAGFIAGAFIGIENFLFTGAGNIWQLWSCIPLALAVYFGNWKSWRIPALVLTLLFIWGGAASCVKDVKRSGNLKMISSMYHDRAGFDFEKVFPPLPEKVAVGADDAGGMRFKSLDGSKKPYIQFLNALPPKSFKPLAKNTVVLRYNGNEDSCETLITGDAFYKDLGKGFGAVAEYNGECCALFLIRGAGN